MTITSNRLPNPGDAKLKEEIVRIGYDSTPGEPPFYILLLESSDRAKHYETEEALCGDLLECGFTQQAIVNTLQKLKISERGYVDAQMNVSGHIRHVLLTPSADA